MFEISPLERETINISSLNDSLILDLINNSILKDKQKNLKDLPFLEYLLKFLDAYDFAGEGPEDIQEDSKTLINASVLGKVFEKINGYKDGSIFTPGFITMYMCREAIRPAVMQKFKDKYNWNTENFDDLKNFIADRRNRDDIIEFNEVVNSLKICDPAVGSGHFLVSSLNEIIAIKSELGIFADESGTRISDYDVTIEQDELIITDRQGDIFQYEVNAALSENVIKVRPESQRLQRTLFHEKQTIIENCLFGVDINPNSVKICMLRLWIELLKNAYYRPQSTDAIPISDSKLPNSNKRDGIGELSSELETLPNIDINIKCGNSLISRFPLNANLGKFGQKEKNIIEQYRKSVREYKNVRDRRKKKELEDIIRNLKNDIRTDISKKDPKLVRLNNLKGELDNLMNQSELFEQTKKEQKDKAAQKKKFETEIAKLNKEVEDIKSNAIYKNAFEWRFEFPEVLNAEGEYEGFDVVIGNPPYIRVDDINIKLREYYKINFIVANGKYDIYYLFYQKSITLLKTNSKLCFITPNRFTSTESGFELRDLVFNSFGKIIVNSVSKLGVFENARTYPAVILLIDKGKKLDKLYLKESQTVDSINELKSAEIYTHDELNLLPLKILPLNSDKKIIQIYINQKDKTNKLSEYILIQEGLRIPQTIEMEKGDFHIVKQYQFSKYSIIKEGMYAKKTDLFKVISISSDRFKNCQKIKIIIAEDALQIEATLDDNFSICQGGIYFGTIVQDNIDIKYILSLLNSKFINSLYSNLFSGMHMGGGYLRYRSSFLNELPFRIAVDQKPFINLVDKILESKKQGKDTTNIEEEIDRMVYELYGLTEEEIKIVEGKS
ncbi:MAG: Eco57I restriction-modification methylase domain-containing protein [bacterium]